MRASNQWKTPQTSDMGCGGWCDHDVIASSLLYRHVAPKGWREWSRVGLVQVFIIALSVEMYGFL
jgi:hypothetical protein